MDAEFGLYATLIKSSSIFPQSVAEGFVSDRMSV